MAPDWHKLCEIMLDYSIPLRATVNLAKILTREEVEIFAKFSLLTVSIDTVDPQLLKQYRKAADLRTISQNIVFIKSAAYRLGIPQPQLVISAVYYAEIVPVLEDVPTYAAAIGAQKFSLQDLVEYSNINNNVTPVWKSKGEQAVRIVDDTYRAIQTADRLGLDILLPGDFLIRLDKLKSDAYVTNAA
jgi:hypothetical protein